LPPQTFAAAQQKLNPAAYKSLQVA